MKPGLDDLPTARITTSQMGGEEQDAGTDVMASRGDFGKSYPLVMTNIAMGNGYRWPIYRWFTY
jgi:hypothetical protein